jgi:CHAT domain-containing protein
MRHLQGVNTIYFSPSNMFYQVGIEYLPCDAQHRIGDLYELYRLSSTKSLAQRKPADKIRSAVIYGGLVYDMDEAQLQEQHDKLLSEHPQDPTLLAYENVDAPEYVAGMQRTLDSLSVRGSVHYLPGTRREASFIADQLFQNGIEPQVFMENSGIEETFKRLGGTSPSIIHIATHGFSLSRNQIKERKDQLVFLNEQTDNLDNMLNYSGLLMSGANYRLRGNKLPKDLEDGILTAREIAQVDLGNVGLVVLSACQTALGEVRSDGVFGIQRSFKKAGAHSLLMSLWPVSDQATELMMTYFYKYLMEGKTRQQAFKMAQKSIQDEHFTDPVFWASFILLDGI